MTSEADKENEKETQPVQNKVKFEVYGDEIIQKTVNASGNSGRIYLPPDWIGRKVKVIKI